MKEKLKKRGNAIVLALACLLTGYLLGNQNIPNNITEENIASQKEAASEETVFYKDTIAVVNLDVGIAQDSGMVNYGTRLLANVQCDVSMTSLEKARTGIETGEFSAYLIIPSAFSKNVTTMNYRPQKTIFQYSIGSRLKGEQREETVYRLQSIYDTFRNDLTQIYVSSILGDYHEAQDDAKLIMERDGTDLERLMELSLFDLMEFVELPETDREEREFDDLDVDGYCDTTGQLLAGLDETYQTALANGTKDVEGIRESFEQSVLDSMVMENKLAVLENALESYEEQEWDEEEQAKIEEELYARIHDNIVGERKKTEDDPIEDDPIEDDPTEDDPIEDDPTEDDPIENNPDDYYYDVNGAGMLVVYNEGLEEYKKELGRQYTEVVDAYEEVVQNYDSLRNGLGEAAGYNGIRLLVDGRYDNGDSGEYNTYIRQAEAEQYIRLFMEEKISQLNGEIAGIIENRGDNAEDCYGAIMDTLGAAVNSAGDYPLSWEIGAQSDREPGQGQESKPPITIYNLEVTLEPTVVSENNVPEMIGNVPEVDVVQIAGQINSLVETARTGSSVRNGKIQNQLAADRQFRETLNGQLKETRESYQGIKESQQTLSNRFRSFDMDSYVDWDKVNQSFAELVLSQDGMQTAATEYKEQYTTYLAELFCTNEENMEGIRESLEEGQKQSEKKLEEDLGDAKEFIQENGEQNLLLLGALTKKLPYTRLGELENKEVYEFIAQPVVLEQSIVDVVEGAQAPVSIKEMEKTGAKVSFKWVFVLVPIGFLIFIYICLAVIRAGKKHSEEY